MKILLIGPMPDPVTGVSVANEAVVKYLRGKGMPVSIINTHVGGGVSGKHGAVSLAKAFGFLSTYLSAFKVAAADVIYLTPGQTFLGVTKYAPFILLALLFGKPYVFHVHGNYLGKEYQRLKGFKKKVFKFLVGKSAAGIALSQSLRKNFEGILPPEKVHVVENFVGDEILAEAGQKEVTGEIKSLFLSNLMKEKGAIDFLEALKILKDKGVPFKALVAGNFEEETKAEAEALLKELKPEVEYAGVVKGPAKVKALKETNIFVLPTYYIMEGQPISILEAMAAGSIIITTRHAGIPDVATEENALFVPAQNPQALAQQLETLSGNKALFEKFYKTNTQKARENYTEEKFGEKLLKAFKSTTTSS